MMKALKLILVSAAAVTLFAACGNNCRNQNDAYGMGYSNSFGNQRCTNLNNGFNGFNGYNGYNGYNNPYGYNMYNTGYMNRANNAQSQACQQAYAQLYPGERWVAVNVGSSVQCMSVGGGYTMPMY